VSCIELNDFYFVYTWYLGAGSQGPASCRHGVVMRKKNKNKINQMCYYYVLCAFSLTGRHVVVAIAKTYPPREFPSSAPISAKSIRDIEDPISTSAPRIRSSTSSPRLHSHLNSSVSLLCRTFIQWRFQEVHRLACHQAWILTQA
jgi:hypothetical protein